jgi:hypothetical protein
MRDYLQQKELGQVARGEVDPEKAAKSPFYKFGETAAGMGGDVAGLVGAPFASPKAAALTAGSVTPIVRSVILPYLAYQGAKMMAQGRQPQETEQDFLQRILLGGSMASGSVAGMGKPAANVMKFVDRARSLEAVNKASVGLLQGKLAPLAVKMDALMENRVKTRAQAMEQADQMLGQQRGGQPTITPTNLTTAHAGHPSPTFETPKAANLYVEAGQQIPGSTFSTMRDLRTRIGRTASALERSAGKGNDARILWSLYDGISKDMEAHATGPLKMPGQWKAYNTDATAMFDIQRGKLGHLFDTRQYSANHPSIRLFTSGETPAIGLVNDLGDIKTTPSGEVNLWKEHMRKLGLDPKELTDSLDHARTLSSAHDSFTGKGQMGGMWRVATSGTTTGLLALGIYGAAHGMGIYGMMPYLMAIGATRGTGTLKTHMDAGVTMKELEQSLPPEAFRVGRALSDQPLPTTGVNIAPPPPPAQTTPPVQPAPPAPPSNTPSGFAAANPGSNVTTTPQSFQPTGQVGGFRGGINPKGVEASTAARSPEETAASQAALVRDMQKAAAEGTPAEQAVAKRRLREMGEEETLPKFGTREELAGKLKGARQSRSTGVWRGKR